MIQRTRLATIFENRYRALGAALLVAGILFLFVGLKFIMRPAAVEEYQPKSQNASSFPVSTDSPTVDATAVSSSPRASVRPTPTTAALNENAGRSGRDNLASTSDLTLIIRRWPFVTFVLISALASFVMGFFTATQCGFAPRYAPRLIPRSEAIATLCGDLAPLFAVGLPSAVGIAMVVQNLWTLGPFLAEKQLTSGTWETSTTSRGWPFQYFERVDVVETPGMLAPPSGAFPMVKQPSLDPSNSHTQGLLGNVFLAFVMVGCSAASAAYWRRHQRGPFQFRFHSLILATTILTVVITLIDKRVIGWGWLFSVPIAAGILSVPTVVGLWLEYAMRHSDRRLTQLRRQFRADQGETI